jgi:hypothetical protein
MFEKVAALSPQNDAQRALKGRALDLTTELARARLRLFSRADSSLPTPFLVVLLSWLSVLFAGYGLLTSPNATVVSVLVVSSLSVCGAILLIMELNSPFGGLLRISSAPLQEAIALLGT